MTDIHDIRPPLPWVSGLPAWAWAACIFAVVLVAMVLLLARRKKTPQPDIPAKPEGPTPLQRLAVLSAAAGLGDKTFYFELTAIIREEISGRLNIPALEMTTEEILLHLKFRCAAGEGGEVPDEIRAVLVYGDTVKFAGRKAGAARRGPDLESVGRWLETPARPPENPPPEPAAPDENS